MTFDQARTRFAVYLGAQEITIDPIISTTDRDALINEAYLEYEMTYGSSLIGPTAGIVITTPTFNIAGTIAANQVVGLEACESAPGGVGEKIPLIRASFGSLLRLHSSEGAIGPPRQWGTSLVSRNQLTQVATYRATVYPAPDQSYTLYFFIRTAKADLSAGADVMQLDDVQADYAIRVAAYRAGYTLGYDDMFLQELVSPLPDAMQVMMHVDHRSRFSAPEGLARKLGEDARAV